MYVPKDWRIKGISFEGNNGGSYIRFRPTEREDVVEIEVGHDCITAIKPKKVNVYALAAILTRASEIGFSQMIKDLNGGDEPPKWAEPH